jgi:hypothetical protein
MPLVQTLCDGTSDGAFGAQIQYGRPDNFVTFNITALTKVDAEPVMDPSGRATAAVKHTLQVKAYVTAGGLATDKTLANMRNVLQTRGLPLIYVNKGYGQVTVHPEVSNLGQG